MKLTYKIYGHPSRMEMVKDLQKQLNVADTDIYLDDRKERGRCIYTLKKAMFAPIEEGETHRLAIPEDMIVCDNFREIAERMVASHPHDIIGLFPFDYQHTSKVEGIVMREGTPYVRARILSCCGIIMPIEYIEPCFTWIKDFIDDDIEDDIAIQHWAKLAGVTCITTVPSTVQHIGDNSIVTPNAPKRVTKYFCEHIDESINWDSPKTAEPPAYPPNIERLIDNGFNEFYLRGNVPLSSLTIKRKEKLIHDKHIIN